MFNFHVGIINSG